MNQVQLLGRGGGGGGCLPPPRILLQLHTIHGKLGYHTQTIESTESQRSTSVQ